jgi:hypothetical protein
LLATSFTKEQAAMRGNNLRLSLMVAGALALPSIASADYVCSASRLGGVNVASTYGKFGSLSFTTYTGPACTGSYVGSYYFCSEGGTFTGCSSSVYANLTDASLAALSSDLITAAREGQRVTVPTSTCNGGAAGCAGRVYFYGN